MGEVLTGINVSSSIDGDLSVIDPNIANLGFAFDSDTFRFSPLENFLVGMAEGETWTIDLDFTTSTQIAPVLPDLETDTCSIITSDSCFTFTDVPSDLWFDPPTAIGFEYQMTSGDLFTQISEFPTGIDGDGTFEVYTRDGLFGSFTVGQTVTFNGNGVDYFRIEGIDPAVDPELADAFPVRLAFNSTTASFEMAAIESVPEPLTILGSLTAFGLGILLKKKRTS